MTAPAACPWQSPSLLDQSWQLPEHSPEDQRTITTLQQQHALPEFLAAILHQRGITATNAADFLNPKLKTALPDPFHLKDMEQAATRTITALAKGETITIWGDYDVDGATSTALLLRFFAALGYPAAHCNHYIPDRLSEGYGPNAAGLLQLHENGTALVICVDSGTVAFEPLKAAANAGLDVIVLDHHLGAETLPEAVAVVNPNRLDETSPCRTQAAVGISFLFAIAVNQRLKSQPSETPSIKPVTSPFLLSLLDLVALGTVCDVMPLTGLNRAFVKQGLEVLRQRTKPGLNALMEIAGVNSPPNAYHLGFALGPRINAGGRVGAAETGATLLATENTAQATTLAQQLNHWNKERQALEQQVLEDATAQASAQLASQPAMLMVHDAAWHPGVIGIVASRLKDAFHMPAAVIAWQEGAEGSRVGKASCRSIPGVDIGGLIGAARQENILIEGGGHQAAGGFSIREDQLPLFEAFATARIAAAVADYQSRRHYHASAFLPASAITNQLYQQLQPVEPFGMGNPKPRFIIGPARIAHWDLLKDKHLRLNLVDHGAMKGKGTLKAMAFNQAQSPLHLFLESYNGQAVYAAGTLSLNQWQGRESTELMLDDLSPAL